MKDIGFRLWLKIQAYHATAATAVRVLTTEGLAAFYRKTREKIDYHRQVRSAAGPASDFVEPVLEFPINRRSVDGVTSLDVKISVVIPTKNAGGEFDEVLARLNGQKGIENLEIIVIDSGSEDDTLHMAQRHGVTVHAIAPEDFNHGGTRNRGIDMATGEFILFMTQDAIPVGDLMLHDMARVLIRHSDVAAVTCRQIPRSDADLFYAWSMNMHCKALRLDRDKIVGTQVFDALPHLRKRAISSLDNVCTLYRKAPLDRYRFRQLAFAEDLDIGMRFIQGGGRLAFLSSVAVIHSHNRPPYYCLKRSYLDTLSQRDIAGLEIAPEYAAMETLANDLIVLYEAINYRLSQFLKNENDGELVFFLNDDKRAERQVCEDEKLSAFMTRLKASIAPPVSRKNPFADRLFKRNFENFNAFRKDTAVAINGAKQADFIAGIYKIFATTAGNQMALQTLAADRKTELMRSLEIELAAGV